MIINALNIFVNFIVRVLKGIIGFLEEMIPLLLKNVFVLSPFLLFVFVANKLGGSNAAIWAAGISVFFIITGIIWVFRKNITDSNLTAELIIFILLLNSPLLALALVPNETIYQWLEKTNIPAFSRTNTSALFIQNDSNKNRLSGTNAEKKQFYELREAEFLKLLQTSIESDSRYDIIRAINQLKEMNSYKSKPLVIEALSKYYPRAYNSVNDDSRRVCASSLNALVAMNATDVCKLLFEIQAKQPEINDIATEAANKLCK